MAGEAVRRGLVINKLTVVLLAQAIGSAFAAGSVLLLLLTVLPSTRLAARRLWPVLASEALILAAGTIPWLLPHAVLLAVLLFVAARIGFESGSVHALAIGRDIRSHYMLLLMAISGAAWVIDTPAFLAFGALVLGAALIASSLRDGSSQAGSLARFILFPTLPLAAFSHAASTPALAPVLVLAFFLVEVFDSFSLLGGQLLGRTPLVPRLSPRKTWEGLASGVVALALAILALVAWLGLPPVPMLTAGIVVMASALVGDLLGSAAKRRAGVKDYPAVLRVQGGLLDIIDSWLVAGPCLVALHALRPAF